MLFSRTCGLRHTGCIPDAPVVTCSDDQERNSAGDLFGDFSDSDAEEKSPHDSGPVSSNVAIASANDDSLGLGAANSCTKGHAVADPSTREQPLDSSSDNGHTIRMSNSIVSSHTASRVDEPSPPCE